MSEAMTTETIIEAYWRLQGYWTKLRFAFQTPKGGWSDIDVLAYNPEKRVLVISESKVQGPKNKVYAYTEESRREDYPNFFDFAEGYLSFLTHLKTLCSDGVLFDNFGKMVGNLVIQLVSNIWVEESILSEVKKDISKKIRSSVPNKISHSIRVDKTSQIVCQIIRLEKESGQGRRYGHPVIDIAREINRYLHPSISGAGKGRIVAIVKEQLRLEIEDALR